MHQTEKVEKPWGHEIIWAKTDAYVAKILFVKAGESLSLQYHKIKEETMYFTDGKCQVQFGKDADHLESFEAVKGTVFHIPPGRLHRLTAVTDCTIFEVSTPHLTDVVRLQDSYGRV